MRALLLAALAAFATPALADPVTLVAAPMDDDGRVTLGELFEGAGSASGVVVASRTGPTVVLDAGLLQAAARQSGLVWSNPQGLRRVIVRQGVSAGGAAAASPAAAARRGQTVEVLT